MHPRYIDLIVIALIGITAFLMSYLNILEFIVPPMMAFYYAGKWTQKKFGTEKEFERTQKEWQ
jgi:hypothetical protein